jgi:hypothetical protein
MLQPIQGNCVEGDLRSACPNTRPPCCISQSTRDNPPYNPNAFLSEYGGQTGERDPWQWESAKEKRPGHDPGHLLFAHRKEVVSMRQIRLDVAIRIDHRFVLAVALGAWSATRHRAAAQKVAAQPPGPSRPTAQLRVLFYSRRQGLEPGGNSSSKSNRRNLEESVTVFI